MADTPTTIVNQAIQLIGDDQPPVTGVYPTFDSSLAGVAAAALYGPCVATVGQKFAFGFSRQYVSLTLSGNTAPMGWAYEYLYPTTAIEIRQLMPMTVADLNNPLPQNWSLGNSSSTTTTTTISDLSQFLLYFSPLRFELLYLLGYIAKIKLNSQFKTIIFFYSCYLLL